LTYELFLDEEAKKISKSKGNGLSIDEWLKYAPKESLSYYMFQAPKRAKRLYFDVIPEAMDEYIDSLQKYHDNPSIDNPVFHIHNGNPPYYEGALKFSLLLNLVQACNTADVNILMQFIDKYLDNPSAETRYFITQLAGYAIEYYKDFVANSRVPIKPTGQQVIALKELIAELQTLDDGVPADVIQNIVFKVGKKHYSVDIKLWFKTLYNVLFGVDSGPKMGSFISLYGIKNTINLINDRIDY
jgi:lysyl-tRNA synthetase class 1